MMWLSAWLMGLLFWFAAGASWALEADWTEVKHHNDIRVYNRPIAGSPLKEFKGVALMDASLSECIKVLDDSAAYHHWFQYVSDVRELKVNADHSKVLYVVHDLPWPVQDRDNVLFGEIKQNPATLEVLISISGMPTFLGKDERYIRVPQAKAQFVLSPVTKEKTQVTYFANVDSGGDIPAWLSNAVAVDAPYYTLKKMRTRLLSIKGTHPHFDFIKDSVNK